MEKIPSFLSVVMPVFNEEQIIEKVIEGFHNILINFENSELVLVDDCSTDSTPAILKSLNAKIPQMKIITFEKNRGHGPALLRAYKEAKGDLIFHSDSDNQFPPAEFWLLYEKLREDHADIVIGCRSERKDRFARLLLSSLLRMLLLILFSESLPDSNSPFRLHTRTALEKILPTLPEDAMIPSILMAVAARKLHLRITWVNVKHLPRLTGISFLRSWKIFKLCGPALKEVLKFKSRLSRIDQ